MLHRKTPRRGVMLAAFATAAALLIAGCGSSDSDSGKSDSAKADAEPLVVYSGREEELVGALYERFEKETGIKLEVRYADSPALAAQLAEEGDNTPADVFYAQDAGAIGSVEDQLAELSKDTLDLVPAEYRDPNGRWVGVTGRVRTLVYNTDEVKEGDLPASVLDLTKPEWKGKVGVAPTNSSFQAFVSAMRLELGDDKTLEWLKGMRNNDARTYEKNGAIVDAVAAGEAQVGLVNHYYVYETLAEDPETPVANHFFGAGDIGNLVNVSAAGVLASSERAEQAEQLVQFLLDEGQTFIVEEAEEREYPLVADADLEGNERYAELTPLAEIDGPDVALGALGGELEATVRLITESGLGTA